MTNYDEIIATYCPLFRFHGFERALPCSIEHLLANGTLKAETDIYNPSPEALFQHCGDNVYVDIASSQYPGMPLKNGTVTAPLYFAVQTTADGLLEISYIVLYANQDGQTIAFRAPSPLPPFDMTTAFSAILHTYGEHQGDLERVGVRLIPSQSGFQLFQVSFEAHGDDHWFTPDQCYMESDTHPLVHVALNGHSHHNRRALEEPLANDREVANVWFTSVLDDGGMLWRPWVTSPLVRLGLDDRGVPINENHWAKFRGRLGKKETHDLQSATYLDGTGLSDIDWATVRTIDFGATISEMISEGVRTGDGPRGPGDRDWITPERGAARAFAR